jgi:hypothetical protein
MRHALTADRGQSLVEFMVSATVASLVVAGTGWLLRAQWERGRCAYLVFEATHARRAGMPAPAGVRRVRLRSDELRTTGEARCQDALEQVTLPGLEAARW